MNYRIYTEKMPHCQTQAQSIKSDIQHTLGIGIEHIRLLNVYDLFGFSQELCQKTIWRILGQPCSDHVFVSTNNDPPLPANGCAHDAQFPVITKENAIAMEYLPGQFDQRAAAAQECVRLIDPSANISIRSGRILVFEGSMSKQDMMRIQKYLINPIEMRLKDLSTLSIAPQPQAKPVAILTGFLDLKEEDLPKYCHDNSLAMSSEDLQCIIAYFKHEGRCPTQAELRILDTYWSDHCRHTTFNTEIMDIDFGSHFLRRELAAAFELYMSMKREMGRGAAPVTLMDIATIGAKWLHKHNFVSNWDISDENNAASIRIDVDTGGAKPEKWLLLFKNETHNHPTEIEPYGGASTCLGGAIRDPLSGRAFVFQAMRVTGAGNIYAKESETMHGKLPQRSISTKAAHGYSDYGNQIGVPTTHVREIYHPNYAAKRLECGVVVGAVPESAVQHGGACDGDIVFLIGGRTGRDGIGGATGSSKAHTAANLDQCGSEVQKGNAPQERKIMRLMRRCEASCIIKKCNDFGAGGVAVAIGELADGVDIFLDRIPVKYDGLNAAELAISESQERMAVVIAPDDADKFAAYCAQENIEATQVGMVTGHGRMRMFYGGERVVDLERGFINSAGAKRMAKAIFDGTPDMPQHNPFVRHVQGATLKEKLLNNLRDDNVLCQKGLGEMFDSTIGSTTVLMPYGGKTQRTETQVSAQKICHSSPYPPQAACTK
jgi:phosphoribosylformylglycinamidine synthase